MFLSLENAPSAAAQDTEAAYKLITLSQRSDVEGNTLILALQRPQQS